MRRRRAGFLAGCGLLLLSGCVTPTADYERLEANYEKAQAANRQLESQNQALQTQLGQAQQSTYTVAADMLFARGTVTLTANGRAALNDIATRLKLLKNPKITVYGYTDDQNPGGSFKKLGISTNQELSTRRADAVARYLVAQGVGAGTVSAEGRADTHPIAANTTTAARARNRRVEIVVEPRGG